jgi:phytanoyl-CoA dioxygenase PhyH
MTTTGHARPSIDTRTRSVGAAEVVDPARFFAGPWLAALERNGQRAALDASYLGLRPLALAVDDDVFTLRHRDGVLEAVAGGADAELSVTLERGAFADFVNEERTALGLVVGARVDADPASNNAFCAWDPVLRSALDGRAVYRPGTVSLRDRDGAPLDLDQRFRLGDDDASAAHFLAEAGFALIRGVFTEDEMDAVDADLARAVESASPDDGASWWAATRAGERYPCRILDLADRSPALRALIDDPRFLAIGELLGDGHRPGDPFGEHFSEVTAEGLLKRVDSVEGLVCLPWHKDCDRGGHSMFCSGLTIGICLTPVDVAHGGLDVFAGSHRAHIARAQVDRGLDLPAVTLRAQRGDVTVHTSCTLHRSTHPTTSERRVAYTGFALPPRPGDRHAAEAQPRLRRERSAIGSDDTRTRLGADAERGSQRR